LFKSLNSKLQTWRSRRNIARTARAVARRAPKRAGKRPVAFFNASTRLTHLSLNAAFSLLGAWGLRLAGVPAVHFVCQRGMSRCVLGTDPDDPDRQPPCSSCIQQSQRLYAGADVRWFGYHPTNELERSLEGLGLEALQNFNFDGYPLGEIVLPSLRWALRCHHLPDDEGTRFLFRQFILSTFNVAVEFNQFLDELNPQAVVLFNGTMYPEAIARHIARQRGIRTVTHEVGLRPFSAFFTEGQATAYPMDIPAHFQLSPEQDAQLDAYLSERFQGKFSMAGIQFWPHMQELDADFLQKAAGFKQLVPVFTNVVFDTSQIHANTLFPHMFAWLDALLPVFKSQTETLFVIRAHPDEMRPGTRKQSRESVRQWVVKNGVTDLPNVVFIDSQDYISSYALIQRAHFVMVYNSSIGLEASIMGKPVLSAGAARYTHFPTVYFPTSGQDFIKQVKMFLAAAQVEQPSAFTREARRVLYFQLFKTALPFDAFLESHPRMGYVNLKSFDAEALMPANSPAIRAIHDGVMQGDAFLV
jgi:hypothetical protein